MASPSPLFLCILWISSLSLSSYYLVEAQSSVPLVKGLSWRFYASSCPKAESIIRQQLKKVFKDDIGQAAGLLRLHFHDCFVQEYLHFYCDPPLCHRDIKSSNILLDDSFVAKSSQSEKRKGKAAGEGSSSQGKGTKKSKHADAAGVTQSQPSNRVTRSKSSGKSGGVGQGSSQP